MEEVHLVRRTEITMGGRRRVEELKCLGYRDQEGILRLTGCVGRSYPLPKVDAQSAHPSSAETHAA